MKLLKILFFCTALYAIISCDKEESNDYKQINEVLFGGIKDDYTVLLGDSFKITPKLNFTKDKIGDQNRYTYNWSALNRQDLEAKRITLAQTKDLNIPNVSLSPGDYDLTLSVQDKQTGVTWYKKINFIVRSSVFEGWLILDDSKQKARLNMLSLSNGSYRPIYDVLNHVNSPLKLKGKPINVATHNDKKYRIYVTATETGTTRIDPENFGWEPSYALSYEMLSNTPENFAADFIIGFGRRTSYMYKDGNYYFYNGSLGFNYGLPINNISGDFLKTAPFIGLGHSHQDIFYDNVNKRFVRNLRGKSNGFSTMPKKSTLFDYNTGKELIYMVGVNYNDREVFAILKETANNKLFLARIFLGLEIKEKLQQIYYEEIPASIASEMNKAKHFAVSPQFGYIFYNVKSKIYEYDFSLKTTKLMIDKGAEEITLMKFEEDSPFPAKLIVASYDKTSANGTFTLYTVPPVNGALKLFESYKNFGKIKSVAYRRRAKF